MRKSRRKAPFWGELVRVENSTLINLRTRFDWPGGGQGMLVAAISIQELSRFMTEESRYPGWTGFILYNKSSVLGALLPARAAIGSDGGAASVAAKHVAGPGYCGMSGTAAKGLFFKQAAKSGTEVRVISVLTIPSIFIVIGQTDRYGATPWYFGAYTDLECGGRRVQSIDLDPG